MTTAMTTEMLGLAKNMKENSKTLSNKDVLSLDFKLHKSWAAMVEQDALASSSSPEVMLEAHAQVRDEMALRGLKHSIDDELDHDGDICKGIRQAFGSYGGKRFLSHKIASFIPYHKSYIEPFAGGGAVYFAKDPSPQEVLNDRDPEIAFMYRFIRDHTIEDRRALEKRDWVIRPEIHDKLKDLEPSNDRERFYKSYYLTRSSYGKQRGRHFNPANAGVRIDFPANIERAQKRLVSATIHNKDYDRVLKDYDDKETFFYIDPPYPDTFNLFDFGYDEKKFLKTLGSLKANWIVSYPVERVSVFKGYHIKRVKRRNQMKGPGGNQEWVTEILVSNFPLKPKHLYIDKAFDVAPEGAESMSPILLPQLEDAEALAKIQAAFKSPGGKFKLFNKIISLVPEHKCFVEAFCGGAQVFFHKKRSDEEVINDVNPDLVFSYRFMKGMTDADLQWLKKQNWVISKARAERLFKMQPRTARDRFYRFAYLNKAHYWGRTDVQEGIRTGDKGVGYHIKLVNRLPEIQERLKGVRIHNWDWKEVIKEYDSPDTFFYLDPPYPLHWPRETGKLLPMFFKEDDLLPILKKMKGQFLLSYELEKMPLFKGFKTYRIKTQWSGSRHDGLRPKYELLVSNFPIKESDLYVEKSLVSVSEDDALPKPPQVAVSADPAGAEKTIDSPVEKAPAAAVEPKQEAV